MPTFGRRSKEQLNTVRPELRKILGNVIQYTDFTVLCGRRGIRGQTEAYSTGRSNVRWPDSAHNCPIPDSDLPRHEWREDPEGLSRAIDIAPWPIDWEDKIQFAYLAGSVISEARTMGIKLRWGGDWDMDGQCNHRESRKSLNDMPHFELVE